MSDQVSLVVFCLNNGVFNLNVVDIKGRASIHHAVNARNTSMLSVLLLRGADLNCMTSTVTNGVRAVQLPQTALHMAVRRNDVAAIAVLLASDRVDANVCNGDGKTLLALAVALGLSQIAEMLIQLGVGRVNCPPSSTGTHSDHVNQRLPAEIVIAAPGLPNVFDGVAVDHVCMSTQFVNRSIEDDDTPDRPRSVELHSPALADPLPRTTLIHDRTDNEESPRVFSNAATNLQCQYHGGKCEQHRTTKINGTPHKLCHEHRLLQNEKQRRSSSKRRLAVDCKRPRPSASRSTSTQCQYAGRKCSNLRDHKPNGDLHLFCKDHRRRHNTNQRSVDHRHRQRMAERVDQRGDDGP